MPGFPRVKPHIFVSGLYVDVVGRFGLTVAFTKTKVMTAGADDTGGDRMAADPARQAEVGPWLRLEHVADFSLLGSVVQDDAGYAKEVGARLKTAGAAYARLKPTCFSSHHLSRRRKFRVFEVFVLTKLLFCAELWRMPPEQWRRLEKFYNRCLRTLAGRTLWTMARDHVSDADIRTALGARPLPELVDRACLRWYGHVVRMPVTRLPQQLLYGRITAWPLDTSRAAGPHRYSHRCLQALRHFGIDSTVAAHAAQDATRWRGRINRGEGWARRLAEVREGRLGRHGHAEGADAPAPDCWPRPSDFQHVRLRRCPQDLACEHCGHRTPYHAWMAMHKERCHKSSSGRDHGGGGDAGRETEVATKRSGPDPAPEGQSQAAGSRGRGAESQTHAAGRKDGGAYRRDTPRSGSSPVPGRQSREAEPHGTEAGPQAHPVSSRKADPVGARAPTPPLAAKRRRGDAAGARTPTPPPLAPKRRRGDASSGPDPEQKPTKGQSLTAGSHETGAGSQTHAAGRKTGGAPTTSLDTPRSGPGPAPERQSREASPPGPEAGPQTHPDGAEAPTPSTTPTGAEAPTPVPRAAKRRRGAAPAARERRDEEQAAPDSGPQPAPEHPTKSVPPAGDPAASRSGGPPPPPKPRGGIG